MRYAKMLLIICLLSCLLTGCKYNGPIPLKMVQWIHISGASFQGQDGRYLYEPESLTKFLWAVRQTGQTMRPRQDPDTVNSPEFRVTMVYADGRREKMYVKGDRYIRHDDGPWRQADPEKVAPLHYLLHFLPGDAVS